MSIKRKYNEFYIQITDTDNDIDLLEDNDCELVFFELNFQPFDLPTFKLKIKSKDQSNSFVNINNLSVKITMTDDTAYSYDLGIENTKLVDDFINMTGYLCKYNDFVVYDSEYLGDNIKDSILALDIRSDIQGDLDEINSEYFRIQETKAQALIRILRQCSKNSIFSIERDKINILSFDKLSSAEKKDFIPYSKVNYMIRNDRIKTLLDSEKSNVSYSDEKSNLSLVSVLGKSLINISDNSAALVNYGDSILNKSIISDTTFSLTYDNMVFDYDIGNIMTCDSDFYSGSSLLIINKIISFTTTRFDSSVLLCGVTLKEE